MIAQYTATKKYKSISIYKDCQSRNKPLKVITVSGKVEAKKICKANNIIAWNF